MNGLAQSKDSRESGSLEILEMTNLNGRQPREQDALYDDDNESTGGDEGETALLRSGQKSVYAHIKGNPEESTWCFVRGILVEVSLMSFLGY